MLKATQLAGDLNKVVAMAMLASLAPSVCWAAEPPAPSEKLRAFDVGVGKWVFHGETLAVGDQKAENWTWIEDCSWSPNKAFLTCSYVMNYPDKVVRSQVVNTYNRLDQSYWHYEMFDSDQAGAEPFISKMTVSGNTWTNFGKSDQKTYRVVYEFVSPSHVKLRIELTSDDVNWTTLAQGDGVKQP